MNVIPTSIETQLLESGFSSTEILVLRQLMEHNGLTLRELAAKTGKSTGVLDQATKKLLRRSILKKEWINESYKYTLDSLQAISRWIQKDTHEKQEQLDRKFQNFEAFISSLEVDQRKPDIQYFEGDDGLKRAYTKLLELGPETLHYFPVTCLAEDDPLRDFRVQYFRERHRRGIFSRVIAHDTPLGRRYQSRDPFEYRKTILVPESLYPFTYEKVIAGKTVACFNHAEKRACFIAYPELADTERVFFERTWNLESEKQPEGETAVPSKETVLIAPDVSLKTKTLSALREFFPE